MTDTNERVKALEERVAQLEALVTAAHDKADELHRFLKKMDDDYYGMMKNAVKKYGVVKAFCEHAGPLLLECHKLLFPERSLDAAKRLTFIFEGNDETIN